MTDNVAGKKQNYFKSLSLDQEGASILQRTVMLKSIIQIKEENAPANVEYTKIQPSKADRAVVYARHISGPSVGGQVVTMMMEVDKTKYFAQGKVMSVSGSAYEIKLINIYELQRRNFFRVNLPTTMFDAKISLQNGLVLPVLDLAIGGVGVAFDPKHMKAFDIGVVHEGSLKVGPAGAIDIQLKVRHRRRRVGEKGPHSFVAGCELVNLNQATMQKLAAVVNDCHRLFFMRMKK